MLCTMTLSSEAQFTYISPVPGSKLHNKETNIILRTGKIIDAASLKTNLVSISGTLSGLHECRIKLADDKKSILVYPVPMLSGGETVTVTVNDGIRNENGEEVRGTTFKFQTHPDYTLEQREEMNRPYPDSMDDEQHNSPRTLNCNFLPAVNIVSTPGAYYDEPVFYRNQALSPNDDCFRATIISSEGDSIYSFYDNQKGYGFEINDNGYLTYYNIPDSCFDMMDSSYNVVKQFFMGNGYNADEHEFKISTDGYYFLMCVDKELMNLTQYGGSAHAVVFGTILQELDPGNNVIFEWRSWDHFQITDADDYVDLTYNFVDYVHTNSIDLDGDGNLLISNRNSDEITKINLATGAIMWRLGGENNQFTFMNETSTPQPFSHQHDFRRLANGHYSMCDNGNYQIPQVCIAKEYEIDTVNMIATLVWSYQHPQVSGIYIQSDAFGSVQYLPNGNRLIDWGRRLYTVLGGIPSYTEVDSLGNIVWELSYVDSFFDSYRVFKFAWDRCHLISDFSLIADNITTNSCQLHWNDNAKFSGFNLEYKKCGEISWNSIILDTNFYELGGLEVNTCYDWRVLSICAIYDDSSYTSTHQFTTLNLQSASEVSNTISPPELFPNPASGKTELKFYCGKSGELEIMIYNLLGQRLSHQTIAVHSGLNKLTLDLTSLAAGIFQVETKMNDAKWFRKLVVYD